MTSVPALTPATAAAATVTVATAVVVAVAAVAVVAAAAAAGAEPVHFEHRASAVPRCGAADAAFGAPMVI